MISPFDGVVSSGEPLGPSSATKVKITVYYWPDANMGLGHIACVAREVGGDSPKYNREIYITPGSIEGGSLALESQTLPYSQYYTREQYLQSEMTFYNSPNVIQIDLPLSDIIYEEFLKKFAENARANLDEGYSLTSRNCAHLASQVLHAAYDNVKPRPTWGLLPSTIARDACSLLDRTSPIPSDSRSLSRLGALVSESSTAVDVSDAATESITRISRYKFAETMLGIIEREIVSFLNKEERLLYASNFSKFFEALRRKPPDDGELTKYFSELQPVFKKIEQNLSSEQKGFFKTLKSLFYGFVRLFSQDPELEHLRSFRNAVNAVEEVSKNPSQIRHDDERPSPR